MCIHKTDVDAHYLILDASEFLLEPVFYRRDEFLDGFCTFVERFKPFTQFDGGRILSTVAIS